MHDGEIEPLRDIADYYSGKLQQHGQTPKGVDWNGEQSQTERFRQLSKIIYGGRGFSLNDLGCGYGALLDFLNDQDVDCSYLGVDISKEMIEQSQQRHKSNNLARFITGSEPDRLADYGIASGILNVRLNYDDNAWFKYVESTLDALNRTSQRGFAFNCLTSYSDEDKKRDYLYYADPCRLFDLCKQKYSKDVALLHDYGLYEFTILVRKLP